MGKPVSLTMSQTGVRLSLLLSLLTITISSGCTDYICRHEYPDGKSVTKIPVNYGDRCAYFTQEPDKNYYPPPRGVWCITKYNRGDDGDCPLIKFECESLHLHNRDKVPWRCNKGDKMIIYEHFNGEEFVPTKKFCRNKTPRNIRSTNGLKINLKIERWTKGGQGGRDCRIKCRIIEKELKRKMKLGTPFLPAHHHQAHHHLDHDHKTVHPTNKIIVKIFNK